MQYLNLLDIRNQYPTIFNYKRKSLTEIRLDGKYPQNFIDFEIPDLGILEVVEDTSFRFIVQLKYGVDEDEYIGLYTSPAYYQDLLNSKDDNNPYFMQNSFDQKSVVSFNINNLTEVYNELLEVETELDVKMTRNIFYKFGEPNDYTHLIKYIDWAVTKPELRDIGTNSTIPVSEIAEYEYAQYVIDSGIFEYIDNLLNEIRLSKQENELSNINTNITDIEGYLNDPDKSKLLIPGNAVARLVGPAGVKLLSIIAKGSVKALITKLIPVALLGPVGFIGATVLAAGALVLQLIGAAKKKERQDEQIEQNINKLKSELVKLKERRLRITSEIEKIKG
jgi:hypothetical protein